MAGKYLAPRRVPTGCPPKGGDSIRERRKRYVTIALAAVSFLIALGLTVYPVFSNRYIAQHQSQIHTEYRDTVQALPDEAIPEARAAATAYNEALWNSTVQFGSYSKDSMVSASEAYHSLLDLTGTGTMGYVHIPKLAATQPIYHGTEEETLERGVGHLMGSSLPVGGSSTHTILTGHSGLASQKLFSDLDKLEPGDRFYLEVLDEVLEVIGRVDAEAVPDVTQNDGPSESEVFDAFDVVESDAAQSHHLLVNHLLGGQVAQGVLAESGGIVRLGDTVVDRRQEHIVAGLLMRLDFIGRVAGAGNVSFIFRGKFGITVVQVNAF